jgi:hypothetical protein
VCIETVERDRIGEDQPFLTTEALLDAIDVDLQKMRG